MTLRARGALAAIIALFIASAMLFVSRPGIEADEAVVIGGGIYTFFGLPVMHFSYVGALKTWFYLALFSFVKPTQVSLRVPMVLAAAAAVWLFFVLLDRTIGRRVAWIGALLLATDSMYIILNALDFGPNALHFVFKLGAMVFLVRFHRDGSRWALAAAFFLIGLALWDKAIFIWAVFGVSLATLIVFPREVLRHLSIRNLAIAAASALLGALPLVAYNIARPFDTFRSNAHMTREPIRQKITVLEVTMNGTALFGFFTSVRPAPTPGHARSWFQKASQAISETAQHPAHNLTIPALCLACLGLFARASRKPVLFGLLACVGTWLPMIVTAGTGGASHHVILLWPFHFLAIAAGLAAIPWAWVSAAACALLCASNLLVTNEYYWQLVRNGPDIRWTDALYPLESDLERLRAPAVYVVDWGILESLILLSDGAMPVRGVSFGNPEELRKMIADPRSVFVAHTPGFAYFPGDRSALEDFATSAGYEEVSAEIVYDRYGRATFDVFRFRKIPL
jgi:4-amino-4-deoxy-L-arabinose transferase-like glycosyltransferase